MVRLPPRALAVRVAILVCVTVLLAMPGIATSATYQYDTLGRLEKVTNDDGSVINYTYDLAGNRETVTTIPAPISVLQLSAASYSVAENGTSVTVTVTRTGGSAGAVSVSYGTANGSAVAGSDYTSASGTLNWANGDVADKTFAVTITNDAAYESNETFTVSISSPSAGASLGSPSSATVTIANDDPAPPVGTLQLGASSYSVAEGAGSIGILVTRTGGSFGAASVNYSTSNGTASAASDYTASSGTLNWADGDAASKNVSVPIIDDSAGEANETFTVNLSGASGAGAGSPASATVTITDNDIVTLNPSASTTYPTNIVFSITQLATLNGNAATILSMTVPGGCGSRTIAGGGQSVTYTPPNYSYNYCVSEEPPPMACEVPYVIRKTSTGQDYPGTAHITVYARAVAIPDPCP